MPLWASEGDGGGAMFRERLGCDGEGTVEEVNRSSDCVLLDVGPALVVNDGVDPLFDHDGVRMGGDPGGGTTAYKGCNAPEYVPEVVCWQGRVSLEVGGGVVVPPLTVLTWVWVVRPWGVARLSHKWRWWWAAGGRPWAWTGGGVGGSVGLSGCREGGECTGVLDAGGE